ncbi:hypothetical protein NE237_008577 [Protea cynaroides]|uniref:Uncharacterized protein n=1 Tax=Protea cynaroides TaxID=273540 RepID=A0A9Q0KVV5_9MAGN|nr:hypothetical protein NE237_008577 [Protea cynaroides]
MTKQTNGSTGGPRGVTTHAQAGHDSSKDKHILADGDGSDSQHASREGTSLPTTTRREVDCNENKSVFESCWVAWALVEKSQLPRDIEHVEAWTDQEAVQRCFCRPQENQRGLQCSGCCHEENGDRVYGSLQGAVGSLGQGQGGLRGVSQEAIEVSQSGGGALPDGREAAHGVEQPQEKLYRKEVIAEYPQSAAYIQAVKDVGSGYFREGALYLRSYLDKQGIVVDYSICLSFADEGENLGRAFVEELKGIAGEDRLPNLLMFGALPQTPLAEEGARDPPIEQTTTQAMDQTKELPSANASASVLLNMDSKQRARARRGSAAPKDPPPTTT